MELQNFKNRMQLENDIAFEAEKDYLEKLEIDIYYFQSLDFDERCELVDIDDMNDYVNEQVKQKMKNKFNGD